MTFEVAFHDCDPLGVVWHGNYFKYFELARTRLLTSLGLDGEELLSTGYRFFVIDAGARYVRALRYRDRAQVTVWLTEWQNRLRFEYRITLLETRINGAAVPQHAKAARGHIVLATVGEHGELALLTPPAILARLRLPTQPA